jgi:hypothetical protein
LETRNYN